MICGMPDAPETSKSAVVPGAPPDPPRSGLIRRTLRKVPALLTVGTLLALSLGAVGQLARDRSVVLALMVYVPLPLVGAWAAAFDLLRRGRAVPRVRFGLAGAGIAAALVGTLPMI